MRRLLLSYCAAAPASYYAAAAAAILLMISSLYPPLTGAEWNSTECLTPSPSLRKFAQLLTLPPSIDLSLGARGITLGAYKVSQNLHPDLPNTTLYAFGTSEETAAFPGPTLMAQRHMVAHVRWENHIPDEHHFLPNSLFVKWANPKQGGVPIVVHLHGAEVPSIYDGHPDAWITMKNETGPTFVTQDYFYPNDQPAMTLWYHDHTFGITRLNVLAGLVGMYIIRPMPDEEEALGLPEGAPLIFKDMHFYNNGSLMLLKAEDPASWCPEYYDVWLVNGKVWPYVPILAKPYRFRILNACNARFTALFFNESTNIPFWQIGTDRGLLRKPMPVEPYLLSSPGERADVIIDFSGLATNSEVVLRNYAVYPTPTSVFDNPDSAIIMKFIVVEENASLQQGLIKHNNFDGYLEKLLTFQMQQKMASPSPLHELGSTLKKQLADNNEIIKEWSRHTDVIREIPMVRHVNENGSVYEYTLGLNSTWHDPVDIIPRLGSYEVWEVINLGMEPHNFHLHLVEFQVLNVQAIDRESYLDNNCSLKIPYPQNGSCFMDYPQSLAFYHEGWKDTAIVFENTLIRILIHFTPREHEFFTFDATQGPGYALHCHILQHEDHSIMRPFILVSNNQTSL